MFHVFANGIIIFDVLNQLNKKVILNKFMYLIKCKFKYMKLNVYDEEPLTLSSKNVRGLLETL